MRVIAFCAACVVCWAPSLQAADLLSGTWTAGDGPRRAPTSSRSSGDRFTGIVCGPCDDPASVFRIEDGRILGADRASFFIRHDAGGPASRRYGPYRERVEASVARNAADAVGAAGGRRQRRADVRVVETRGRELRAR